MKRSHLPEELGETFSVRDALRADVPPSRLAALDLTAPYHGVRSRARSTDAGSDSAEQQIRERVSQYAARMTPKEFFSHVTSAVLWGIPLPAPLLRSELLDVAVLSPARLPRSAGVSGHEVARRLTSVVFDPDIGVRLASPASTWAMLASVLWHPYDLVAAGDAVVREQRLQRGTPPLSTPALLAAAVRAGRRVGVPDLRLALPRVCTGSASRPETWLRLTLIDAGLPVPALNFEVFEGSTWLARVDLAYPHLKIAIEYEGEHHLRDYDQWMSDIRRYDRLAEAGWRVIRVTKDELFSHPERLVSTVRKAMAQRA